MMKQIVSSHLNSLKQSRFSTPGLMIFILVFGIIGAKYLFFSHAAVPNLVNTAHNFNTKLDDATIKLRQQVQQSTNELTIFARASKGHLKNPNAANGRIVQLSKARLADLKQLMQTDPIGAQAALLPDDIRQAAAAIPGAVVEKPITLGGTFVHLHEHTYDARGQEASEVDVNSLKITGSTWKDQQSYDLFSADPSTFTNLPSGTGLSVQGLVIDNQVFAQSVQKTSQISLAHESRFVKFIGSLAHFWHTPKAEAITSGNIKVAVIGIQLTNAPALDINTLKNTWTNSQGIAAYWHAISYGKATMLPDFYGPYTITNSSIGCSYNSALVQAVYNAANADVNYTNYNRIDFAIDCTSSTGQTAGTGIADVGEYSVNTPDGTVTAGEVWDLDTWGFMQNAAHEQGHNFGDSHSNSYDCAPDAYDPPTRFSYNCSTVTYGDPYDIMGGLSVIAGQPLNVAETNSYMRTVPGWLGSGNLVTLNSPGTYTYTLAPLELATSSPQAIFIPLTVGGNVINGDAAHNGFWIDYRQPLGWDNAYFSYMQSTGLKATGGPMIHAHIDVVNPSDPGSLIIDTTPYSANPDEKDSPLLPGKTFTDLDSGVSVKTNSVDANGANVTVTIPQDISCVHAAPLLSASQTTQNIQPGGSATFSLTLTNNDSSTCSSSLFRRNDVMGGGETDGGQKLRVFTDHDTVTLNPGASTTIQATFLPNQAMTTGSSHSVQVYYCPNSLAAACSYIPLTEFVNSPSDTQPPSPPTGVTAQAVGSKQINLSWQASTDNLGVADYYIYRDGAYIYDTNNTYYIDTSVTPGTTYSYTVKAQDYSSNNSPLSSAVSATTPAAPVPIPRPAALTGFGYHFTDSHTLVLSWSADPDAASYQVWQTGVLRATIPGSSTSYTAQAMVSGGQRDLWTVYAVNGDGALASAQMYIFTPKDGTQPPTSPTNLQSVLVTRTHNDIFWTPSTDDKGIGSYKYFVNGRVLGTTTVPAFSDTTGMGAGLSNFVQAIDSEGNVEQSLGSYESLGPFEQPVTDTTAPTVSVISPTAGSTVSGSASVNIAATDNVKISGVELFVDSQLVAAAHGNYATSFNTILNWDSTRYSNGNHTLTAKAYDGDSGNIGTSSSVIVSVSNGGTSPPPDTTPPSVSITSPAAGSTVSGNVSVSATASDNVAVANVIFSLDASTIATDTASPYTANFNAANYTNGTHTITATATDTSGNSSSSSVTVNVSNPDTTPPSTPTNLTAAALAYNQVNLSWFASTDNVAVTGYYIVRNGTTIAQVNISTNPCGPTCSYSDTSVTSATTYAYQVMAADAAGNTSNLSNTASVTTPSAPDTTPPSAPSTLAVTAVSSSQINLTWNPSSDNIGVASYDIYRGGTKLTSVAASSACSTTSCSFGDTGLTASTTYAYYVVARDAAGNASSPSTTASTTTQPNPPPATSGSLNGIVSSSRGGVVSGASVSMKYSGSSHTVSTDLTGFYQLSVIPAGSYSIKYSKSGFISLSNSATIPAGTIVTKNVTLTSRK